MNATQGNLDKLTAVVHEAGYTLRYERGTFQSGWCLLQSKHIIVLNKFLNTEARINTLMELIPQLPVDLDKLTLASQKLYEEFKENGSSQLTIVYQNPYYLTSLQTPLTITFLGTGTSTGIPMIGCTCEVCLSADEQDKRLRSSILVQSPTTTLVVDTTPDFRQQMLRINNIKLDAVLFTHPHKDHIAGLDDVRPYNFFSGQAIDVYANALTGEALKKEFSYVFAEHKYPGIPNINLITLTGEPFVVGDIPVTPIAVWHHKMPVYGFRFGNFTYITDANRIDEHNRNLVRGSQTMVVNALRRENHISHFTLSEAMTLVDDLQIPQAYFTHISHQLGKHKIVNESLPKHISLAYDGLTILS